MTFILFAFWFLHRIWVSLFCFSGLCKKKEDPSETVLISSWCTTTAMAIKHWILETHTHQYTQGISVTILQGIFIFQEHMKHVYWNVGKMFHLSQLSHLDSDAFWETHILWTVTGVGRMLLGHEHCCYSMELLRTHVSSLFYRSLFVKRPWVGDGDSWPQVNCPSGAAMASSCSQGLTVTSVTSVLRHTTAGASLLSPFGIIPCRLFVKHQCVIERLMSWKFKLLGTSCGSERRLHSSRPFSVSMSLSWKVQLICQSISTGFVNYSDSDAGHSTTHSLLDFHPEVQRRHVLSPPPHKDPWLLSE